MSAFIPVMRDSMKSPVTQATTMVERERMVRRRFRPRFRKAMTARFMSAHFPVAEARNKMVVHHPDGLKVGIDGG